MIEAHLYRQSDNGICTIGRIVIPPLGLELFTLELPWHKNAPRVSCIPAGTYLCGPVKSPRFGAVYGVHDVPGRSHILFHAGNSAKDTLGCILLGMTANPNQNRIGSSRLALDKFLAALAGQPFTLTIHKN